MKPLGEMGREDRIDVAADAERGMFVAIGADQNMMAASVIEVGGWAVRGALPVGADVSQDTLERFLVPDKEEAGLYAIADGVEIFFKHPVTGATRQVVSPKITELQPAPTKQQD